MVVDPVFINSHPVSHWVINLSLSGPSLESLRASCLATRLRLWCNYRVSATSVSHRRLGTPSRQWQFALSGEAGEVVQHDEGTFMFPYSTDLLSKESSSGCASVSETPES